MSIETRGRIKVADRLKMIENETAKSAGPDINELRRWMKYEYERESSWHLTLSAHPPRTAARPADLVVRNSDGSC